MSLILSEECVFSLTGSVILLLRGEAIIEKQKGSKHTGECHSGGPRSDHRMFIHRRACGTVPVHRPSSDSHCVVLAETT